jgi:hypothetical protein
MTESLIPSDDDYDRIRVAILDRIAVDRPHGVRAPLILSACAVVAAVVIGVPLVIAGEQARSPQAVEHSAGAGPGAALSRTRTYASLASLAGDSSLIATGTVVGQHDISDSATPPGFVTVVSQFRLDRVLLGDAGRGNVVEVRQLVPGGEVMTSASFIPPLGVAGEYLLYLLHSGLPGDAADQFFVTGGGSGAYERTGTDPVGQARYRQVLAFEGDALPASVTASNALGG